MSRTDHATIEELLAVRALGGLEPGDEAALAAELTSHGDCPDCLALERGFAETAASLAGTLDPVRLDDAVVERLITAARGETGERSGAARSSGDDLAARRRRRAAPAWLAAAAAFVVLVGTVAVLRPSATTGVSTEWRARVVRFAGAEGELAMAYVPGEPGVAFWGKDLPDPGPDHTYEIWMIDGDMPIPGGCVSPVDGRIAVFVEANVGTTDLMAVTVEPASCPPEPTGEPVLTAPLS